MAAPILNTLWHWLRTRAGDWSATGLLPPPPEKLRWPHQVKLYLLLSVAITAAMFVLFFVSFFSLYFAGLYWPPPTLSVGSFVHASIRCWQIETGIRSSGLEMAFGPLWLVTYIWNRRAVRLTQQQAALAAPTDITWPPPPQRPV